jgi:hypothetical protein
MALFAYDAAIKWRTFRFLTVLSHHSVKKPNPLKGIAVPAAVPSPRRIVTKVSVRQSSKCAFCCKILNIVLFYLLAVHTVLKRWQRNLSASKMEIGVWHHWHEVTEGNRLPLSPLEVAEMKRFLRTHGPVTYRALFE